jgi:hypothetical protein
MMMAAQQPDLDASSFIRKKGGGAGLVGVREKSFCNFFVPFFLGPFPFLK